MSEFGPEQHEENQRSARHISRRKFIENNYLFQFHEPMIKYDRDDPVAFSVPNQNKSENIPEYIDETDEDYEGRPMPGDHLLKAAWKEDDRLWIVLKEIDESRNNMSWRERLIRRDERKTALKEWHKAYVLSQQVLRAVGTLVLAEAQLGLKDYDHMNENQTISRSIREANDV
ncbi:MAG: hypothetical protein NVSMB46_03520 [Candidatus Saccharimonadales bacterium]